MNKYKYRPYTIYKRHLKRMNIDRLIRSVFTPDIKNGKQYIDMGHIGLEKYFL